MPKGFKFRNINGDKKEKKHICFNGTDLWLMLSSIHLSNRVEFLYLGLCQGMKRIYKNSSILQYLNVPMLIHILAFQFWNLCQVLLNLLYKLVMQVVLQLTTHTIVQCISHVIVDVTLHLNNVYLQWTVYCVQTFLHKLFLVKVNVSTSFYNLIHLLDISLKFVSFSLCFTYFILHYIYIPTNSLDFLT